MAEESPIEDYMASLMAKLTILDQKDKQQIEADIKEELADMAAEKAAEEPEQLQTKHEQAAVDNYVPADEVAAELIRQHHEKYDERFSMSGFTFSFSLYAFLVPLFMFQLPIYHGTFEDVFGRIGLYGFLFWFGVPLLFFYFRTRMTPYLLQSLRFVPYMLLAFLLTALVFFAAHAIRFDEVAMFSVIYLSGYIIVWAIFFMATTWLYRHVRRQVM